jgi:hypothetical protein
VRSSDSVDVARQLESSAVLSRVSTPLVVSRDTSPAVSPSTSPIPLRSPSPSPSPASSTSPSCKIWFHTAAVVASHEEEEDSACAQHRVGLDRSDNFEHMRGKW